MENRLSRLSGCLRLSGNELCDASAYCPLCGRVRRRVHAGEGHMRSLLGPSTHAHVTILLGAVMGALHRTEVLAAGDGQYYALVITRGKPRLRRK
jgi:hypothetical protein